MTRVTRAILVASAILATGLLAIFDVIPEQAAQFSPIAWLVLLPWVQGGRCAPCPPARGGA